MFKTLLTMLVSTACFAQVTIPDGTKLRVRLDQTISSATADEGQTVELSVIDPIKVSDQVVIPEGARVTGTITMAEAKRRMGRSGKLDFSIDRVRATDGEWVPLRYEVTKKSGDSHAVRTGVITAGVAVVFWPAAPVMLLMKGKDTTINKGVAFDVFTDTNHMMQKAAPTTGAPRPGALIANAAPIADAGTATFTVTSSVTGADIELDGAFVGNTPTTLQVPAGTHHVTVKNGTETWQRSMQVTSGSQVSLNAVFADPAGTRARKAGTR
jgi:hypothetical protein